MLPTHRQGANYDHDHKPSRGCFGRIRSWARAIVSDRDTRNLFCFLLVNLSFAIVELVYGIWTNSLGLISDSFHMFFDCTALVTGLVASLITRNPPNDRYSFGYGRADVLCGLVNGVLLVFIAFFVFKEALERLLDPPHIHTHRLLLVSVLGLVVNLIGVFVFQHGGEHGHSHGGGDHGHSHGAPASPRKTSSSDSHGHSHGGEACHGHDAPPPQASNKLILDGVFLHILADTLGSVGVIVSSLLVHQYEWMIADPICSIFIAVLIFISVIPLLKGTVAILMERTPEHLVTGQDKLLHRLQTINGVVNYRDPHFWSIAGSQVIGTVVLIIKVTACDSEILETAQAVMKNAGVTTPVIQIERF
eukprot:m.580900 g.580900  ORF g.580900 m.580900 type:complete len:362 (+) comp57932_c0_seq2:77-1162(+)